MGEGLRFRESVSGTQLDMETFQSGKLFQQTLQSIEDTGFNCIFAETAYFQMGEAAAGFGPIARTTLLEPRKRQR